MNDVTLIEFIQFFLKNYFITDFDYSGDSKSLHIEIDLDSVEEEN